jgi:cyclophilin family peptidyl-prolyl cis-trans isomerase
MSLSNGVVRSALRGGPRRQHPLLLLRVRTSSVVEGATMIRDCISRGDSLHRRSFATGTRGSRGHGWYQNYRAGKGGRHLQGEYHDRESPEECAAWNDAVLQLGSTQVYMDIVAEPRRHASSIRSKKLIEVPSLDSLEGERYRVTIDIASTVMPQTAQNFTDLLTADKEGYLGSRLYRIEKNVGLLGGDTLTNTGKTGKAAKGNPLTVDVASDPLPMWHIPGTVSMLVPKVGEVDSRFMLCTQEAPHIDGMSRAFGRMTPESLAIVKNWQINLLTRNGIPTAYDLIVVECGVLRNSLNESTTSGSDFTTETVGAHSATATA